MTICLLFSYEIFITFYIISGIGFSGHGAALVPQLVAPK